MARGSVCVSRGSVDVTGGKVSVARGSVCVSRGNVSVARGSVCVSRGKVDVRETVSKYVEIIVLGGSVISFVDV